MLPGARKPVEALLEGKTGMESRACQNSAKSFEGEKTERSSDLPDEVGLYQAREEAPLKAGGTTSRVESYDAPVGGLLHAEVAPSQTYEEPVDRQRKKALPVATDDEREVLSEGVAVPLEEKGSE